MLLEKHMNAVHNSSILTKSAGNFLQQNGLVFRRCPYCDQSYNDKVLLKQHMKSHPEYIEAENHRISRNFIDANNGKMVKECPYCDKLFGSGEVFLEHINGHKEFVKAKIIDSIDKTGMKFTKNCHYCDK